MAKALRDPGNAEGRAWPEEQQGRLVTQTEGTLASAPRYRNRRQVVVQRVWGQVAQSLPVTPKSLA